MVKKYLGDKCKSPLKRNAGSNTGHELHAVKRWFVHSDRGALRIELDQILVYFVVYLVFSEGKVRCSSGKMKIPPTGCDPTE